MTKGKCIIFEGISGTGKETQARLLQEDLKKRSIAAHIVYHPSPELKSILSVWRKERSIDHITEVYLLLADRYDRVRQEIIPALERGEWVIGLRNWISALVYQGKTAMEREWITKEFHRFEPNADVVFHFDIMPSVALERIVGRYKKTGESLGKFETPQLLKEKRDAYSTIFQTIPHVHIDAGQIIEQVHKEVFRTVEPLL